MKEIKISDRLKPRKVFYKKKRVSMSIPYCPICGEQLKGIDSYTLPFECSCGIWEHEWSCDSQIYRIKTKSL